MNSSHAPDRDNWYTVTDSIPGANQRLCWLLPKAVRFDAFVELMIATEYTNRRGGAETFQAVYIKMLDRRDAGEITEDNPADLWRECEAEVLGLKESRAELETVRTWFKRLIK